MQKQLKLLDAQLELNHLIRIPDPIPKPANSFFRALSISLFSAHNETQFVKSVMKSTLQSNCQAYFQNTVMKSKRKRQIPFPLIAQSSEIVEKYVNDKQMLQMYAQSPDLDCFQNDNYQLASFTFNRRVSIFYLNKDGYLNETLISSCRNKTGKKINLAKQGKRYYAVQKQSAKAISNFIREYLLGNLISQIISDNVQKQDTKVHFSGYDQIIIKSQKKFQKTHKKSLSQCGDITNKLQQFRTGYIQQIDKNFHTNIKNNYDQAQNRSHQQQPKHLLDRDLDFCQKDCQKDQVKVECPQKPENKEQMTEQQAVQQLIQVVQLQGDAQWVEEQIVEQLRVQMVEEVKLQPVQTLVEGNVQEVTGGNSYPYGAQYQENMQTVDYSQTQGYYPEQQYAMYPGYQMNQIGQMNQMGQMNQYYPDYNGYYGMNMHTMMYPNQYYPYYQQPHQQETYAYTQPQQLVQSNRYRGRLKFYDSNGKYGFIIIDGIGSDLFVHLDDLSKAGISKQHLETHGSSKQLRFEFTYYQYEGKNKKAKKAIDLVLLAQI